MKKLLFGALALLLSPSAKAYDYDFGIDTEIGITSMVYLGMNITNINGIDRVAEPGLTYDPKVGGTLGVKFDCFLPGAQGAYISYGLGWTLKGAKSSVRTQNAYSTNAEYADATDIYRLHYIELPLRVGFRYNIDDEFGIFGEVGPYFAIGFAGKHRRNIDSDGNTWQKTENDYSYDAFRNKSNNVHFQRWDCGLGFRVGVEYNQHHNLMLGCDWGITDMYRESFRNDYADASQGAVKLEKAHNFNFTIAYGFRF